jgi:hypothetical protein
MVVPTEQILNEQTIDQLRFLLVERGGSWAKGESKTTLINRILELGVAVQANEKVKPAPAKTPPKQEPAVQVAMTIEEAKEAVKPWLDRGVTIKFSPDKKLWLLEFTSGKISRTDSGNMAIPPAVLARCAEMLVRPKAGDRASPPPEKQAMAAYSDD